MSLSDPDECEGMDEEEKKKHMRMMKGISRAANNGGREVEKFAGDIIVAAFEPRILGGENAVQDCALGMGRLESRASALESGGGSSILSGCTGGSSSSTVAQRSPTPQFKP